MTKGKRLMSQAKSMVAITRILEVSSEAKDNLLVARHRISHAKATCVEVSNIKQAIEMEVIMVEEGKNKIADLLGMK